MTQFLEILAAVLALSGASLTLIEVTSTDCLSREFNLICGVLAFAAAIAYGSLTTLGVNQLAPLWMCTWFIVGSMRFERASLYSPHKS